MKKNIKIIILCFILLTIFGVFLLIGCRKERATDEILEILEDNGYDLYYYLDGLGNMYDKNQNCYDFNYNKQECVRDFIDKDSNSKIFLVYDNQEIFTSMKNELNNEINVGYIFEQKNNSYIYFWNHDLKNEYIIKTDEDDNKCVYLINGINPEDYSNCDKSDKEFNKVSDELNEVLNKLDVSKEEIIKLFQEFNKNQLNQHLKEEINNKLSNEEVEKNLKSKFVILNNEGSIFLNSNDYGEDILITFKDDNLDLLMYANAYNSGFSLMINYSNNTINGFNKETNCIYNLNADRTMTECLDSEITTLKLLKYDYNYLLRDLGITQIELENFALNYYNMLYN